VRWLDELIFEADAFYVIDRAYVNFVRRPLRKVRYFDEETRRDLVFLTNHPEVPALSVARLYKLR